MIPGTKSTKIASYVPLSHGDEIYGTVVPKEGETFIGIPFQWYSDNSPPFIEIRDAGGNLLRTVNAFDCSDIEFLQ